MYLKTVFAMLALSLILHLDAYAFSPVDSMARKSLQKRSTIRFTTRLHSLGFFSYGGRIACDNPSFDFNFTYERKNWGYILFKAVDLFDLHSHNNFTLTLVYKNFHLGERVTVTPYAGVVLEQAHQIADYGSDASVIILTAIKLNDRLKIDNTTLFSNLILEREFADWVNRFRILYSHKHTDLTFFTWHNNQVFDSSNYLSFGLSAAYSRIKMTEHIALSTSITGLIMAKTSDPNHVPVKHGLVFTVAAVFDK